MHFDNSVPVCVCVCAFLNDKPVNTPQQVYISLCMLGGVYSCRVQHGFTCALVPARPQPHIVLLLEHQIETAETNQHIRQLTACCLPIRTEDFPHRPCR